MKILYLMTEPFGVGGVQSDLLMLSEDLTARGHDVHVATTDGVLLPELLSRGARFAPIDFAFRSPLGMHDAARRLRRLVRASDIELVAPQSVRSSMVAYLALRAVPYRYRVASTGRRVPIVATVHNIHDPRNFRRAGKLLRRCADYVIFESHYERNRLLAYGLPEDRSTVIHSGIDIDRLARPSAADVLAAKYGIERGRHLVYGIVARLSEEKGHNYLVDAFALVARQRPEARLMVVGDGPLEAQVRAQVSALGLDDRVIFTGMQRDIASHLALLDVFVLSSTRESFPLSAREAMAASRAVIAPRIGGCPEVVDEGVSGLLFTARDVDDLSDKMLRLSEREIARAMGRAGRERAERLFSRRAWIDGDERMYLRWVAA